MIRTSGPKIFQEAIEQKCKESGRSRLKNHCATRWVEKQEAVRVFKQLLPALWMSLDDIASWPGNASGKASLFTSSLNGEFAVALHILTSVLEVTKPLSVRLQEVAQDIHHACESVRDCITTLQQMRTDETFKKIFEVAEEQHGERIEMSRINARQTNRENHPAQNAEEYYRRSMYFPYLDVCLEQLRERFTSQSVIAYALKAAAHRLAIATAIGNPQGSNDLRLRFQRQNQATMHTARERLRCDRCDLLRLL